MLFGVSLKTGQDHLEKDPTPRISFLGENLLSKPSTYPMIYSSEDGSKPPFGCSGAPVLEARVAIAGKNPVWQFRVLGAVYARCAPEWYDSYANRQAIFLSESSLLCAIPVLPDFEQIRKDILIKKDQIERSIQIISSCGNSLKLLDKVKSEQLKLSGLLKEINQNILLFREGATQLKIDLPQGLEKLLGSSIISLDKSFLVIKKFISKAALLDEFNTLIKTIGEPGNIKLYKSNEFWKTKNLRVDVQPASDNRWKLDIQDNTGKKVKINGKSASSIFSTVMISTKTSEVSGKELAEFFEKSRSDREPIDYDKEVKKIAENLPKTKERRLPNHKKEERSKKFQAQMLEQSEDPESFAADEDGNILFSSLQPQSQQQSQLSRWLQQQQEAQQQLQRPEGLSLLAKPEEVAKLPAPGQKQQQIDKPAVKSQQPESRLSKQQEKPAEVKRAAEKAASAPSSKVSGAPKGRSLTIAKTLYQQKGPSLEELAARQAPRQSGSLVALFPVVHPSNDGSQSKKRRGKKLGKD